MIPQGSLVDIHTILLSADQRSSSIPEDTKRVNLEMKVKGILCADASPGDSVEIETPVGRRLRGTLIEAYPAYKHRFGPPIPELVNIGGELRRILRDYREAADE